MVRGFQKPYINSNCRYSRRAFRVLNISRFRDQTVVWAFSKINKHLLRLFQIHLLTTTVKGFGPEDKIVKYRRFF